MKLANYCVMIYVSIIILVVFLLKKSLFVLEIIRIWFCI